MTGAATGATPFTAPMIAIILASSLPLYRSAATERDSTIPPDAPSPWNRRMARNISMLSENMHNTVAMQNMTMDSASMGLRPYLSLRGPKNTCPRARPTMLVVRPSCTMEAEVSNSAPSEGRVGRYMSVTKGAKADSSPRKMTVNVV